MISHILFEKDPRKRSAKDVIIIIFYLDRQTVEWTYMVEQSCHVSQWVRSEMSPSQSAGIHSRTEQSRRQIEWERGWLNVVLPNQTKFSTAWSVYNSLMRERVLSGTAESRIISDLIYLVQFMDFDWPSNNCKCYFDKRKSLISILNGSRYDCRLRSWGTAQID